MPENEAETAETEYRYAINIADLMGIIKEDFGVSLLVRPVLAQATVAAEGKDHMDGMAIVMLCEADRCEAIIHMLRNKYKKHQLRCYKGAVGTTTWKRI